MSPKKTRLYAELVGVIIICATAIIYFSIKQTTLMTLVDDFPPLPTGVAWQQEFDDEFNGTSLNPSYWTPCYDWYSAAYSGCSNTSNKELEWYTPSQVHVGNGYAELTALPFPIKGLNSKNQPITYPYRSGMISTGRANEQANPKETFLYGFFEARIRVTSGKGIWPAFWLTPANRSKSSEIDVMEILGNYPQNVVMTYRGGGASNPQQNSSTYSGLSYFNSWHTYAINWEPGHIDWYVDGVLRKSVTGPNVPSQPMEVIANLAVGGNVAGTPDTRTPFPALMDIDYIRVYKQVLAN